MARKYQRGNLTLKKRANGPDVWEFRWRDTSGTQRSKLIGTVEQFPTERDAQCATDALRLEINSELPKAVPITVATLVDRYPHRRCGDGATGIRNAGKLQDVLERLGKAEVGTAQIGTGSHNGC